jgi:hypothetical protein
MASRVNGQASEHRNAIGRLRVVTEDGRAYGLDLEAGPACFGFRHVLNAAARLKGERSHHTTRGLLLPSALVPAARIRKLFSPWIKAGHTTRFFDHFAADVQRRLTAAAGLVPEERPLVACYLGDQAWTLLTATRLIWRRDGRQTTLAWEEVIDVQELQRPIRPDQAHSKGATSGLQVVTRDGHAYALELEAGPPFFGFWAVLKTIARARHHAARP